MITMFGKTAEEILEALAFYEFHNLKKPVRKIEVHFEYINMSGQNYKLETWSDKGLTLWVNDDIVYQHNK